LLFIFKNNEEQLIIYGVNSKCEALLLKVHIKPIKQSLNKNAYYSYQLIIVDENGTSYSANESGVVSNYTKSSNGYRFAGLYIQVLHPFRKWRIKFCGYLKINNSNDQLKFVRIRLLWTSVSNLYDFYTDGNLSFLAKQLTQINSRNISVDDLYEDRYSQCGQFKGIIQIENNNEQEIYLWGSRSKQVIQSDTNSKNEVIDTTRLMGYSKVSHITLITNIRF
jgi:hypothetical protein